MEGKEATEANTTYHNEHVSTLQACRTGGPNGHENLLPNIHDVELGCLKHLNGDVCFPTNDNAVVGNKRDNVVWGLLPELFRRRVLPVICVVSIFNDHDIGVPIEKVKYSPKE